MTTSPLTHIVMPDQPEPVERHAVEELRTYLAKINEQTLPILHESDSRPTGRALVVGRTKANLQMHNPDSWAPDTIFIGYGADDIVIIGQGTQGTLFATYEFLRDQGCRWYMPGLSGEYIPQRRKLSLPDRPRRHPPSFLERGWEPPPAPPAVRRDFFVWAARNGINTMTAGNILEYGPQLGFGREIRKGHVLPTLIPSGDHPRVKEVFAAHPEWYPLVNGQRVHQYKDGRPVQACLSNPEVVNQVAGQVIVYFREHPRCWRFSISHADEPTYWCECDGCRAMDGPGSTWKTNNLLDAYPHRSPTGPGPISDRFVKFASRVAKIVGAACPGKYISFYAYGSTVAPPRQQGWRLEPNVMIEYANGGDYCLRHRDGDKSCRYNAASSGWLATWLRSGSPVLYYEYPPSGGVFDVPAGFSRRYRDYIVHTKKMGVQGWSGEGQNLWAGSALFHYLKARLLWDVDTDMDALIREFCHDMYGSAAEVMMTFYQTFDRALQRQPDHVVYGSWVRTLDERSVNKLSALLTEAERKADSPPAQTRISMMRVAMNNLMMMQMREKAEKLKDSTLFDRYNQLRVQTLELIRRFSVDVTGQWLDQLQNASRPPFEALAGKELLTLPLVWRFRTDPQDEGINAGWHQSAAAKTEGWKEIRVDASWTDQGYAYHGVAWYATQLVVPREAGARLWLLFGTIDGESETWIDGQSVGKLPGDPYDKPKALEITSFVEPGRESQLVVRVVKTLYAAGLLKPVKLMVSTKKE